MKKLAFILALGSLEVRAGELYGKLPLSFEANHGQTDSRVAFLSPGPGYRIFLTSSGAVLSSNEGELRMALKGARQCQKPEGLDPLPGRSNYFVGTDPRQWRTNVPNFAKVKCAAVYPGIDLVYYGNQRQLEYDFVLAPGADPRAIRMQLAGASKITLDQKGDLAVQLGEGRVVVERKPSVWQEDRGQKRFVEGRHTLLAGNQVGFEIGHYDRRLPLVIDPVIVYASYLSGVGLNTATAIALDSAGNAYVTGFTNAPDFPVHAGGFQTSSDSGALGDAFVVKVSADGSTIIYATFLGGSDADQGNGIAVDKSGNAYVTGFTSSNNFPVTTGVTQKTYGGDRDAFVAKLNPTGSALVYATYLGGSGFDEGNGIALDASGNAYVAGTTSSSGIATSNAAIKTAPGNGDAFLAKLNAGATTLVYFTYLGGSNDDRANAIAVDSSGNAYVTGRTESTNFPVTPGVFQGVSPSAGFTDDHAFAAKLNADGSKFLYATFLGGKAADEGNGIAVDSSGAAYVAGDTTSTDFPTTSNVVQGTLGGVQNAFVTKLKPDATGLVYSTFLGGSASDEAAAITLDGSGNAFVTGRTASANFPVTSGAFQINANGFGDAFVAKLNSNGTQLVYSTYLGGSGSDSSAAIAIDGSGNAYVAGVTGSPFDFPITGNVFQKFSSFGPNDAFLAKIAPQDSPAIPSFPPNGVVNAASARGGPLAPGEFFVIYGSQFGPAKLAGLELDANGFVATRLGETRVLFGGIPAPLVYAVAGQVSGIVPYEADPNIFSSIQAEVEYRGVRSSPVTIPLAEASPAIFTLDFSGKGRGAILNHDLKLNSPSNPAKIGSVVVIYATGEGLTDPSGQDGQLNTGTPLPKPVLPVKVTIGGLQAKVDYAGGVPTQVAGLLQVNAEVPAGVTPGSAVPVVITVGTTNSPAGVTLAVTQ